MGYIQYLTLYTVNCCGGDNKAAATQPWSRPRPPRCHRTFPWVRWWEWLRRASRWPLWMAAVHDEWGGGRSPSLQLFCLRNRAINFKRWSATPKKILSRGPLLWHFSFCPCICTVVYVDTDLVDLSYEEHYPADMCVLQDCDCYVDLHFFITYKNVCTNDNSEFYLGYVYKYSSLGITLDLLFGPLLLYQLPEKSVEDPKIGLCKRG